MGGLRGSREDNQKSSAGPTITIVGAVVEREGKYLMVERLKRSRGYFEFPGGKLEEGESDQSALVRELKEELKVDATVRSSEPVAIGQDGPVELKCYLADISGDPQAPPDTLSFRWVSSGELKTLAVPPADQAVVQSILAKIREGNKRQGSGSGEAKFA